MFINSNADNSVWHAVLQMYLNLEILPNMGIKVDLALDLALDLVLNLTFLT